MKALNLYIFIFISYLINGYSCFSFDRNVDIDIKKENNISIVASFLDTSLTYQIIINKIGRVDTLQEMEYMNKLFIKDAKVIVKDPTGATYSFNSTKLSIKPEIWGYQCKKFAIQDGDYKLTVEWNGTKYESICAPITIPNFEKIEIIPASIDSNKANRATPYGKKNGDFSNWCDVHCVFSIDKTKEISLSIETQRFSLYSFNKTTIETEKLGVDFLYKHPETSITYKIGQERVENSYILSTQSYPSTGFGINVGDTIKTRIISLNLLQVKLEDSKYTPIINRTNIKNITDPLKPPIGYFVINRYAEKSVVRTK